MEVFNPVLYASPTTTETDAPSGLNVELSAPQLLGICRLSLRAQIGHGNLSGWLHDQPRCGGRAELPAQTPRPTLAQRVRPSVPNQSKIGTFSIGTQALSGPLEGAVYIGEPEAGNQYRLFLIASGFGINVKAGWLASGPIPKPDS